MNLLAALPTKCIHYTHNLCIIQLQIESTTVTESKDAIVAWFEAAKLALQKHSSGMQDQKATALSTVVQQMTDANKTRDIGTTDMASARAESVTDVQSLARQDASSAMRTALQLLALLCALLFLYALLRVCVALEQMQAMTREMLVQQQQQQAFYREVLARLELARGE